MKTTVFANYTYNINQSYKCYLDEVTICPICKHAIKPELLSSCLYRDGNNEINLAISYLCKACFEPFLAHYANLSESTESYNKVYFCGSPKTVSPQKFQEEIFNDFIKNSSPSFVSIYNQALQAENSNLDEIAGIGYRKALEFLIKDFLISQDDKNSEQIKKMPLGQCVNKFIDNIQLNTAASRAVWLGNDQTHYVQKFTDKDINDLKRLIRLTVHWISMILETIDAENIQPR